MHEYDAALKMLLRASTDSLFRQMGEVSVARWLNIEIQEVSVSRLDLLGATVDGEIVQVELQSTNDPQMPLRMAEYCLRIFREYGNFPAQIVLYVGWARMNMKPGLSRAGKQGHFDFRYTLIDFRKLDGASLLASDQVEDNLLAILGRLRNQRAAIRQILARIADLPAGQRPDAMKRLLIISGLRRLGRKVKEEAQRMPVLDDIMDHDLLGPAIRKGQREGMKKGRQEGQRSEQLRIVRMMLEKRLGRIPAWVTTRLASLPNSDLDRIALSVSEASSFKELFS